MQNGVSLSKHYKEIERQTGARVPELIPPCNFPEHLRSVWFYFIDLSNSRSSGFNGPSPITYEQIKAYKELTGYNVKQQDVVLIMKLDRIYLEVNNE